jgi:hypothetical protein
MWWRHPNIDKPIAAKDGKVFYFLLWHAFEEEGYSQKLYFWDKDKQITGLMELSDGKTVHLRKLKDRMSRIANDKVYRDPYLTDLKFPVEKNY